MIEMACMQGTIELVGKADGGIKEETYSLRTSSWSSNNPVLGHIATLRANLLARHQDQPNNRGVLEPQTRQVSGHLQKPLCMSEKEFKLQLLSDKDKKTGEDIQGILNTRALDRPKVKTKKQ